MDLLSDVLTTTRLSNSVLGVAELAPPWGLQVDAMAETSVHVILRGSGYLHLRNQPEPLYLADGDVTLVASNIAHSFTDRPDTPVRPYAEVLAELQRNPPAASEITCTILCAKYLFDQAGPHPLTHLLPSVIHLRASQAERSQELMMLLQLLKAEASTHGDGHGLVVPRLIDTLLVYIVRAWLDQLPIGAGGWYGALRDPIVAKALALMHKQPNRNWTVESLGAEVGQSRAAFAKRFSSLVGEAPAAYLARWRMCLAAKALRESSLNLDQIAEGVGYETAAALSKAFRRQFNRSPGLYRAESEADMTRAQTIE
jgi:AraC-like DNA-binding protein